MAFVTSEAEEVLYGGAYGGGKSYALRAIATDYCLRYPGASVALFRRTYRQLEDTHILAIQAEVPKSLATYNQESHTLLFKNGSRIFFRYCEQEDDVYNYDTAEFDMILFDELTGFTYRQYAFLISRCRSTKPWWPGRRIRAATNPGGVGHAWVKARWIDFLRPYEIRKGPPEEGGMTRQFIPAKVTDNPVLMARDPGYLEALKALPPEEYKARALGDWEVYTGQFFTRWNPSVHVVDPFEIPPDWRRYMGVDFGYAVPHAVVWAARPPDTSSLWIYREQYGAGVAPAEQARRAREVTVAHGEKIEFIAMDPSMWAKSKDEHGLPMRSYADLWKDEWAGLTEVVKADNERIAGALLMQELLSWVATPDGKPQVPPRLFFFRTCENCIRTLPALQRDERRPEDIDTAGEDHAYDAIRYLVRTIFQAPVRPQARRYIETPHGFLVLPA